MGVVAGLYMYDVVIKKFTFAISSPDEFLFAVLTVTDRRTDYAASSVIIGRIVKTSGGCR